MALKPLRQPSSVLKKRKRREDFHLSALTCYFSFFFLVRGVVILAAVYCDIGLFALRHHHVDAASRVLLRIVNGEADLVNTSVTVARAFSAQEDGIAIDVCINWCVAVAESVRPLVLSNSVY